jgi:hypothetical protein
VGPGTPLAELINAHCGALVAGGLFKFAAASEM